MLCQDQNCSTLTKLSLNFEDLKQSLNSNGIILSESEDCFGFIKHSFNSQIFPNLTCIEISAVEEAERGDIYIGEDLNGFHEQLTILEIRNSQCLRLDVLHLYRFSNLTNLTFTNCSIGILPASVGKLENLKELVLSRNKLSTLPYFIVYCKQLELLDLSNNRFEYLPGYLQKLQNIKTLRRLQNPLVDVVKSSGLQVSIKKYPDTEMRERNVPPLQTLCLPVIIHTHPNYWELPIAPTLCRMLDTYADDIVYCEWCYKPGFKPDFFVLYSVLFRCYGLNLVPFGHYSCSIECNDKIKEKVRKISRDIQAKWEHEYNEMVDHHRKEFASSMLPQDAQNVRNSMKCLII